MNLELTIQSMFDEYPALFIERADCLNQLFVVLGSGYRWKNGELVSSDDDYSKKDIQRFKEHLVDGKAFQHNKMSLRAQHLYYENLRKQNPYYKDPLEGVYSKKEIKRMHQEYINKLPDDVYYEEPNRRYRWYCCSIWPSVGERIDWCEKYIPLLNIPEDVKPDWLEGIEETKRLLAEDGLVYEK